MPIATPGGLVPRHRTTPPLFTSAEGGTPSQIRALTGAQVEVHAEGEADYRAWQGWVNSRMRLMVPALQQMVRVRPWPNSVKGSQSAGGHHSAYHYIAIAKMPVSRRPVCGSAAGCCRDCQGSALIGMEPVSYGPSAGLVTGIGMTNPCGTLMCGHVWTLSGTTEVSSMIM